MTAYSAHMLNYLILNRYPLISIVCRENTKFKCITPYIMTMEAIVFFYFFEMIFNQTISSLWGRIGTKRTGKMIDMALFSYTKAISNQRGVTGKALFPSFRHSAYTPALCLFVSYTMEKRFVVNKYLVWICLNNNNQTHIKSTDWPNRAESTLLYLFS